MGVQVKVGVPETAERFLLCSDVLQRIACLRRAAWKNWRKLRQKLNVIWKNARTGMKFCSLVKNTRCGCLNTKGETGKTTAFIDFKCKSPKVLFS